MTPGKHISNWQACDYCGMGRYMTGHGEGQVSRYYPVCGPPLAYKRGWDASGHVANITRDTPLGYPQGLAHEETEARRGGEPRGIRGGGLNRSDCGQAAVWKLSLREAGRHGGGPLPGPRLPASGRTTA